MRKKILPAQKERDAITQIQLGNEAILNTNTTRMKRIPGFSLRFRLGPSQTRLFLAGQWALRIPVAVGWIFVAGGQLITDWIDPFIHSHRPVL